MGSSYQSTSEEESVNDKNCPHNTSTVASANAVIMEIIKQTFNKMFQDNNSKSIVRINNKSPLIVQVHVVNCILITYDWYHGVA